MKKLNTLRALAHLLQLQRIMCALFLAAFASPMFAQFSTTVAIVDPTTGAQQLGTFILHGVLYLVAIASICAFLYGIFRLLSGRPMEGVLEIALGIVVFIMIGNALNWGAQLTGQAIL